MHTRNRSKSYRFAGLLALVVTFLAAVAVVERR